MSEFVRCESFHFQYRCVHDNGHSRPHKIQMDSGDYHEWPTQEQIDLKVDATLRESARVNEAHGVIAFLAGALAEVLRSRCAGDLCEAKIIADAGLKRLEAWHRGKWRPGPHDDPANWRRR